MTIGEDMLASLRSQEAEAKAVGRLTDALLYDLIECGDEAGVYVQAFDVRNGGDRYEEQRAAHVTVAELAGEVIAARARVAVLEAERQADFDALEGLEMPPGRTAAESVAQVLRENERLRAETETLRERLGEVRA